MTGNEPLLFSLQPHTQYGEKIAAALGIALCDYEDRRFEDGEHKARPLVSVRGRDVYVLQSLYGEPRESPDDKLCRLLFFIGTLKDAAAASVTAVVPYLAYARKDRRTQARDPITIQYVARLFEAVGTDRIVTLEVHNLAAYQNAFRCRTEHLDCRHLFIRHLLPLLVETGAAVVSPDAGGVKRAELFRTALAAALGRPIPLAFMEKQRALGVVSGELLTGDVAGRAAIIIDDLISTGTTMLRAARACRNAGAGAVYAVATHGLFVGDAGRVLDDPLFDAVVVTDTVPAFRLPEDLVRRKLTVLSTAPLVGEAIRRINANGSIIELLSDPALPAFDV
ncbi:ribose-phosphate pyrophosphokinase [Constrictibacter sp. MBR-5]|jgi:ribose-phosphate pyrophosphokinase|uniref:ribose-phosphate diphosphokinase n=1 Tax=Constrictibacter sp. MBR-5 TaxID=3156467 RepID=UPI00339529F8